MSSLNSKMRLELNGRTFVSLLTSFVTLLIASSCDARSTSTPRLISEPVEIRSGEQPMASAARLAQRLEMELAAELGDGEAIAFGREQIGMHGEKLMVAAVSPSYGAFAIIPLSAIAERKSTVQVCRFKLVWPAADAEQSAAGMMWASREWPDETCRDKGADDTGWEQTSSQARRAIAIRRGVATVVKSNEDAFPALPTDLRAALKSALLPGERLVRIAPLPSIHDSRAYGWTSKGRQLLAVPDRNSKTRICVIESQSWAEFVKRGSSAQVFLERACQPLLDQVRRAETDRLNRKAEDDPPRVVPLPYSAVPHHPAHPQ